MKCKINATGTIKDLIKYEGVYVEEFHPNGIPHKYYIKEEVTVIPDEPVIKPKPKKKGK